MRPVFFATPADLRAWFAEHAATASEVWVGFYRRDSGRASITWPESVDQALCYGWIDGIRKRIDESSYEIRFTPRKRGSTWSAVNIKRVGELTELDLMRPAGTAAFEARLHDRSATYSYENRPREFDEPYAEQFRSHPQAWEFFQAQPPSYRRTAIWWVVSAKKEETRLRRLAQLLDDSDQQQRLAQFTPPARRG